MTVLATSLVGLASGIPPPLCRGKTFDRYEPALDGTPSPRAVAEVETAYDALCPKKNCGSGVLYQNPTIGNNAATWVSGIRDGEFTRAKIVYSASFLDGLDASFGPGSSFGVLAHEVGHHLTAALSMRTPFDPSWDEELRADYLAGCALGRAGRHSSELENALRALASAASLSHPPFGKRGPAVRKGYEACKNELRNSRRKSGGLADALGADTAGHGCWRYAYRLEEQTGRVGPIAAPRRHSRKFESREGCEAHRRAKTKDGSRRTEECRCE